MNLYRSTSNKVLAGVCGGIAETYGLNATGLRWLMVIVTLFLSGLPALAYVVLWMVLKER